MQSRRNSPEMDFAMENLPALIFPSGSSATTTTTVDDDISLQEWPSPQLNWSPENLHPYSPPLVHPYFAAASNLTSNNTTPTENPSSPITPSIDSDKDRRLIHLLTAAAEALSSHLDGRDLARVILVRLKELISTDNSASGIERLSAHFTDALTTLLDGFDASPNRGESNQLPRRLYPAAEFLTAFQLLQDMSPLASFGHLTANQAILEAVAGERRVHIIDYDIAVGIQWASLIQAMASRYDGAPTPHLKITAVSNGRRRSATEAKEAGRRLSDFAASVGQPFSFRLCRLDQQKRFQPAVIKVVKGEPLVVNCVLHSGRNCYSHGSSASVGSFLLGAAGLGARLVTVIEEELGGESAGEEKGCPLRRFVVELQRYKAIWESLEDGFPKQGRVREMVERVILGPRIYAAVRRAYGRNESGEPCGEWMAAVGFKRVDLSFFNHCQARLLLGFFNEGYGVEDDASNKIVLGWKSRRLLSASVWAIPTLGPPSPAF